MKKSTNKNDKKDKKNKKNEKKEKQEEEEVSPDDKRRPVTEEQDGGKRMARQDPCEEQRG